MNNALEKKKEGLKAMLNLAFSARLLYPRTGLTITHALSHPLGAYTNINHGLAVSFFLPVSLEYNFASCKDALGEALIIMGHKNLGSFTKWFKNYSSTSGLSSRIKTDLAEVKLDVKVLARDAMESSNIQSNPRKVNLKDLEEVIVKSENYWGIRMPNSLCKWVAH
jgi:alcohol dehydrogenase class IV